MRFGDIDNLSKVFPEIDQIDGLRTELEQIMQQQQEQAMAMAQQQVEKENKFELEEHKASLKPGVAPAKKPKTLTASGAQAGGPTRSTSQKANEPKRT